MRFFQLFKRTRPEDVTVKTNPVELQKQVNCPFCLSKQIIKEISYPESALSSTKTYLASEVADFIKISVNDLNANLRILGFQDRNSTRQWIPKQWVMNEGLVQTKANVPSKTSNFKWTEKGKYLIYELRRNGIIT